MPPNPSLSFVPPVMPTPLIDAARLAFLSKRRIYDVKGLKLISPITGKIPVVAVPSGKKRALILLQENSGYVPLPPDIDATLASMIYHIVDTVAESFEDIKTQLQTAGKYEKVVHLTDVSCTRAKLLTQLVDLTKGGYTIDLIVLGHGNREVLQLHGEDLTGQEIRALLPEATARGVSAINLRLVYMCNCVASSLNDDWAAIGAKVSIGSKKNNYMPEPMITFFLNNWIAGQKASEAAANAFAATKIFFIPFYPPTIVPRYTTVTVEVPDGLKFVSTPFPGHFDVTTHKQSVQVPDGVDLIENEKISDSEPVTGGNGNTTFNSF